MPSSEIVVAAAGSGKTTLIVRKILDGAAKRVAVATYTHNNTSGITQKFFRHGGLPEHVDITPWFTFILRQLIRPYRSYARASRIRGVAWVNGISAKFAKKGSEQFFFTRDGDLYSDKLSQYALLCDEQSNGLVMERLKTLYDRVYIDEVQDLAGYDLELVERMMKAGLSLTLVGDPRQCTFVTNQSRKNKKYSGVGIVKKFGVWERRGLCSISEHTSSYRCNQAICDLADSLYPDMPPTTALNRDATGHDGLYIVRPDDVDSYVRRFRPQVLRYDKRTKCGGHQAMNFGASKGLEFPRVLIYPHGPLQKLLKTSDRAHTEKSAARVYVAITRARHSVAFVLKGPFSIPASNYCDAPL